MLCGLGVPSLRSLWGAVRNRQLYILRMYCKSCISFNFKFFFLIYTTCREKKITHLPPKKVTPLDDFFWYTTHIFHIRKLLVPSLLRGCHPPWSHQVFSMVDDNSITEAAVHHSLNSTSITNDRTAQIWPVINIPSACSELSGGSNVDQGEIAPYVAAISLSIRRCPPDVGSMSVVSPPLLVTLPATAGPPVVVPSTWWVLHGGRPGVVPDPLPSSGQNV